ncbi:MAG: prephenate dehydratase [Solirubrobacteraceae bacterium]
MRVGYLGPEGTNTQDALLADTAGHEFEMVPLVTIYDTVMAVRDGLVTRALVPIENSLEGSVNATLDALAFETDEVRIVGEVVAPIEHCLIARPGVSIEQVQTVISHPQANAQCGHFLRTRLARVPVLAASSTADAVRMVAGQEPPWAAIGSRLAAERYGCTVLLAGIEDSAGNETRFVWLARERAAGEEDEAAGPQSSWKTAIVFWGAGSEAPGWLVACLGELAARDVNMTRIESRPRRQGLGRYMFFVDIEGREDDPGVAAALARLRERVEHLRVLGSFPAA